MKITKPLLLTLCAVLSIDENSTLGEVKDMLDFHLENNEIELDEALVEEQANELYQALQTQ